MSRRKRNNSSLLRTAFLECISCARVMIGILSYEARDTCCECGGKSKIERE